MTVRNPLVLIPGGNPQIQELPAGDTIGGAPQGIPGLTWKGAWSSSTTYAVNDAVSSGGSSYICIAINTNQAPPNATYWNVLAAQGNTGASGSNGTGSGAGFICNGRLTLTTATPVTTSDVTGATTVYFTPFRGNQISLYTSSVWTGYSFSEISIALGTLTSGKNYDVFAYDSAGVVTLELSAAWTNDTTRADALALQDGIYVKSSNHSRRYLGTFRTTSTTTTEDSAGGSTTNVGGKRFVWNYYNRVPRHLSVIDTTAFWSYTTDTIRQANGASGNKIEFLAGVSEDAIRAVLNAGLGGTGQSRSGRWGIGLDSTSSFSSLISQALNAQFIASVPYVGIPTAGYHYLSWNERGGDGTCNFLGSYQNSQSGLTATILG